MGRGSSPWLLLTCCCVVVLGWEHELRLRAECTASELEANRAYMMDSKRRLWNPNITYEHERRPPSPACKVAQVASNFAFFPVASGPRHWAATLFDYGLIPPERLRHRSIVYFEPEADVQQSYMCGGEEAFCDVPNTSYFEWKLTESYRNFSRGYLPIALCARNVSRDRLDDYFDTYTRRYHCHTMYHAEQLVYHQFPWYKGWEPFTNDCQNLVEMVIQEYDDMVEHRGWPDVDQTPTQP